MSLLDILKKNLTPEQFSEVQEALGDDFDYDYDMVPRSRLNKVITQRNDARKQVATLTDQLEAAREAGSGVGSESDDRKFTQADIDAAVQAERDKHSGEILNLRRTTAARAKLQELNFVDPDLILSAGLVDLSKLVFDDSGSLVEGLEDQLTSLAETKPYLVNTSDGSGSHRGTGKNGGSDEFGSITSKEEFLKLSYDKQLEFKKAYPDVFRGFLNNT